MQRTYSPVDGALLVERELAGNSARERLLDRSVAAQALWASTPLERRIEQLERMVDAFVAMRGEIAEEITRQMGRPLAQSPWEVDGFEQRARAMLEMAPQVLASIQPAPIDGFERWIQREPLGVVLTLAPWNYPYLCAVNAIIPAMAAGNSVILKHSAQTPLCAERLSGRLTSKPPTASFRRCTSHEASPSWSLIGACSSWRSPARSRGASL